MARRVAGVDYRALAAASFLGLGSIWAQGLSGSAALQMATPGALPPQIREIVAAGGLVADGIIPFRHTIFLWQSLASVAIEIVIVTVVMWLATPPARRARTASDLDIDLTEQEPARTPRGTIPPGAWLEHSALLPLTDCHHWRHVSGALFPARARAAQCGNAEHGEPGVPAPGLFAPPHAGAAHARCAGGHARRLGCHSAISLLCGDCGDHHGDAPERSAC